MKSDGDLDRGREHYRRQEWTAATADLAAADAAGLLGAADLEDLGTAAYLAGDDEIKVDAWARAHHEHMRSGNPGRAAWCAFWLGFTLLNRGEVAQAGGWWARCKQVLAESHDCAEQGYGPAQVAIASLTTGDAGSALDGFGQLLAFAERFGDAELVTLGRLGCGQAKMHMGDVAEGGALFDEIMVSVTAGELSPVAAGLVYCAVIETCHDACDLGRAREWTGLLARWCESQPDLVAYRGRCMVHRTEIMAAEGSWSDAVVEADRACAVLSASGELAAGAAFYQRGELLRLRGDFADAEDSYRRGTQFGHDPQPGLAQLRLAQGDLGAAVTAIRLVIDDDDSQPTRSKMLAAAVEILVEAGDLQGASEAAAALAEMAEQRSIPLLEAMSEQAGGAVRLARGDTRAARDELRRAWHHWQQLDVRYELGRTSVLLGLALRALGDADTAQVELEAAKRIFEELGAQPDLARLAPLTRLDSPARVGPLSGREVEVLRLVAGGMTNKDIASELVLSVRTVERHISNIFTKIDVSSRTAAAAYAFEHDLV